jgi:GNAT superfamily N-acetyltransferase
MEVQVRRLSPELLGDFLFFFDRVGFTDNPGWASCYCCYYHTRGSDPQWSARSAEQNRLEAQRLIREGAMSGYLAYSAGQVVGWCNAGPLQGYARLSAEARRAEGRVAAVVCFVVAPALRHQGVAAALLQGACADLAAQGYTAVEAFPRKGAHSEAHHYHGPLSMYLKQGFTIREEGKSLCTVRREL